MNSELKNMLNHIRSITSFEPEIGLILGSGLGDYADQIEEAVFIPYKEIPGFPVSQVEGHNNRFVLGTCQGKKVIAMQGRFHYYEGYSQQSIGIPIRLMKLLGVQTLLLTNAAGGVNLSFQAGDLMLISDHINFSGSNPLIGVNDAEFGPRFPDMSDIYNESLRKQVKELAKEQGAGLQEGVYCMFSGPNYETPAEIKMARTIGADAVGMSTVPEAIAANHCGMQIIGISCITNMAAGVTSASLNHEEVMETSRMTKTKFTNLVDGILKFL